MTGQACVPAATQRQDVPRIYSYTGGSRNIEAGRKALDLLRTGEPPERVKNFMPAWNEEWNSPPLAPDDLRISIEAALVEHERTRPETSPFDLGRELSRFKAGPLMDSEPPKPEWLLRDLLRTATLAMMCGPGGVGKSTLLLVLAVAVAGQCKEALAWEVADTGPTMFFTFEDDTAEIHRRLYYVTKGMDLMPYDRDRVRKQLYVLPIAGDVRLVSESPRGPVMTSAWADFADLVRRTKPALVILDPFGRVNGVSENDAVASMSLLGNLEALARETGATILVSHHSNKAGSGSDDLQERLKPESVRGSSTFITAVRTLLTCAPLYRGEARKVIGDQKAEDGQYLALKVAKSNYGPTGKAIYFRRGEGGALEQAEAAGAQAAAEELQLIQEQAVRIVLDLNQAGQDITPKALVDSYLAEIKDTLDGLSRVSKARIRDAIARAIMDGDLAEVVKPNAMNRPTTYLAPPRTEKHRQVKNTGNTGNTGQKTAAGVKQGTILGN